MASPSPNPARPPLQFGAFRRWMLTVAALLGVALLMYLVGALVPLARPSGMYAGMGVMMLLPILLLCAALAAVLGATLVAAVAWWVGVRRIGLGLVLLLAAGVSAVSFFAGCDSAWFDPSAMSRQELAAMNAKLEAMSAHRARLQPAIAQGDLPALQAALDANDPTLAPAQLLCLVRTDVIEGHGHEGLPTVSEERYRFLQGVAEAAWNKATREDGRRAIGLLAIDSALRHGTARDVERWLERGVDPRDVDWARDVSAQTEPAGLCSTYERWPLSTVDHSELDPDRKRDLLFRFGVKALPAW
ncbi:hypothetical protein [Stenotrophomonas sp. MH181796]|uniref:hypothetical protein n=1 Tax=Stenotrophomonas sp. MH181796 TaxID=2339228 RepID=UPI00129C6BEB|nr:hypothetical protein [Stenotrophomonas sp. MH181796]